MPTRLPPTVRTKSLTISDTQAGAVHVLHLQGHLDGNTALEVEHAIAAALKAGRNRLVMDLAGLRYIASAGVGVFISGQHQVQSGGGTFILAQPSAAVREVFVMLNLDQIMAISDTLDAGVAAAGK